MLKLTQNNNLIDKPKVKKLITGNLTLYEKIANKGRAILETGDFRTFSKLERKLLQTYILKSEISHENRRELWLRGSGAKTLIRDNPGYYEKLLDQVPQYPNPCFYQIELDLPRTFSGNDIVYTKENEGKMRRVLSAYIKRNPTVGYCQGMNFIAAILLNQLEEEETFWVLCQIIETMLPPDYYTLMTGVIIDQKCFEELLSDHLPDIKDHLDENHYT